MVYLDEPLADPSCIPLYFISRLARHYVTVILSGEGADEILAGYNIYRRMLALESIYSRIPPLVSPAVWLAERARAGSEFSLQAALRSQAKA